MVLAVVAASNSAAAQSPAPAPPLEAWTTRVGIDVGWHTGSGRVAIGRNGPAGEPLFARLQTGPIVALRAGVFRGAIGGEVVVAAALLRLGVENDAGVGFPNHSEHPLLASARGLVLLARGRVRPFVAAGVSGGLLAADLDNRDGPTWRLLPGWNVGAGLTWRLGGSEGADLAVEVRRQAFVAVRPFADVATTAVTVGVGWKH